MICLPGKSLPVFFTMHTNHFTHSIRVCALEIVGKGFSSNKSHLDGLPPIIMNLK